MSDEITEKDVENVTKELEKSEIDSPDAITADAQTEGAEKKKKKKKKNNKKKTPKEQTEPPTVGLSQIFVNKVYPQGEIHDYRDEYVLYISTRGIFNTLTFRTAAIRGEPRAKKSARRTTSRKTSITTSARPLKPIVR